MINEHLRTGELMRVRLLLFLTHCFLKAANKWNSKQGVVSISCLYRLFINLEIHLNRKEIVSVQTMVHSKTIAPSTKFVLLLCCKPLIVARENFQFPTRKGFVWFQRKRKRLLTPLRSQFSSIKKSQGLQLASPSRSVDFFFFTPIQFHVNKNNNWFS